MVYADHGHRARVLRSIAAATFAVVVRGVGIEAGAGVVGIAFAGFFFGLFGRPLFRCFGADLAHFRLMQASGCCPPTATLSHPGLPTDLGTANRRPLPARLTFDPSLTGPGFSRLVAFTTTGSHHYQRDNRQDEESLDPNPAHALVSILS